ncbi:MAG: hypothetical protein ACREU3_03360 [Steroidobacteraceae bacterium]
MRHVSADAPPGFSLAGTWKLDPHLSTDTEALLRHMVRRPKGKGSQDGGGANTPFGAGGRGHGRRGPGGEFPGGGGPGGGAPGGGAGGGADSQGLAGAAGPSGSEIVMGMPPDVSLQRQVLSGGDYLKIEQQPGAFVVWNGATSHSFVPGEHAVVSVPSGVADRRSGYHGKAYWIELRPQVGPSVTERFQLADDGKQLIETIEIGSDGRVRSLKVKRVYVPARSIPTLVPGAN